MTDQRITDKIKACIESNRKITFLVGAGLSAESGIPTFRGADGYWTSGSVNYKAEEIGTLKMFRTDPAEVLKWFLYRKSVTEKARPNTGHFMLKEIGDMLEPNFALITQNVDGLHKKAGSNPENTYLIHGDHDYVRCGDECSPELYQYPKGINLESRNKNVITDEEWQILRCPKCGGILRPHVLWFDEYYNEKYFKKNTVLRISKTTGILFIIGTSGATTLPQVVAQNVLSRNGIVVEVNMEASYFSTLLKNKKNGIVINTNSSNFLTALRDKIAELQKLSIDDVT